MLSLMLLAGSVIAAGFAFFDFSDDNDGIQDSTELEDEDVLNMADFLESFETEDLGGSNSSDVQTPTVEDNQAQSIEDLHSDYPQKEDDESQSSEEADLHAAKYSEQSTQPARSEGAFFGDMNFNENSEKTQFGNDENDRFKSVEDLPKELNRISGSEGDDTLVGGLESADYIDGGPGDDSIVSWYGDSSLYGGEGNDSIRGFWGDEEAHGGAGDDVIDGDTGADSIFGGFGNDTIYGGTTSEQALAKGDQDQLWGDEGNDLLFGVGDDDTIVGGAGNDTLDGGHDSDVLVGGEGDDELIIRLYESNPDPRSGQVEYAGADTVSGGDGSDTFTIVNNASDNEELEGTQAPLITDFDPEEDVIVYQKKGASEGRTAEGLEIAAWEHGMGVDVMDDGVIVARLEGVSDLRPDQIVVKSY